MKSDLPSLAVRRPILTIVLNLLILVAGTAAYFGVDVRELPDVDRPFLTVSASLPGASPETVDTEITSRLEGAVARVSGVKSIRGQSEETLGRVFVEFRPGVDLEAAANETREAVSRIERELPENAERVSIIKADNNAQAVVSLTVSSNDLDIESLTRRVENDLAPMFLTIPGVADVRLRGDRERVLRVLIEPLKLASFGLSTAQVATALKQAPFDVSAGILDSVDQQIIVRANATTVTAQQVRDLIITGTTKIADVASVFFGPADATNMVRLDGTPVVGIEIIRQAQANTIDISNEVLSLVDRQSARFPSLNIVITQDDAQFIRGSVREVIESLCVTVVLVVMILWLFIGSWKATIIPAIAIPLSLMGSLAVIWLLGFSINILTLLALVLATGLIVDDAIVVSENIERKSGAGLGRRAAAVLGTREVFFAVIATTAVLVAVFVPIAFLPSTVGRLFREFGGVIAASVMISSFVALSLVPALSARLNVTQHITPSAQIKIGEKIVSLYGVLLNKTLNRSGFVLVGFIICASTAGLVSHSIDHELLPDEDRGSIRIFARGPDGVGLNFMDRQAQEMEDILLPYVKNGSIDAVYTVVGQWDPNIVFMTLPLSDWSERDVSQQQIIDEIRQPLSQIPGARASAFGANSLNVRRQGNGIDFAILGDDYANIFTAAEQFSRDIEAQYPELGKSRLSYQPSQPQLRVNIDRRRAEDLDVDLDMIATTLRVAINGDDVADLNVGDQIVPIILQAQNTQIQAPHDLANLYVNNRQNRLIPLSSLVQLKEEGAAAELERYAQRRAIDVSFRLPETMTMKEAVDAIRLLADSHLPVNMSLAFRGEALTHDETSNEVTITYILALVIVLLVLAAQFESVNSAIVVMLTVPFGIAGAIFALYLSNTSFNLYSQIGLVMLIGLVAKNAILLVEFADQLRDKGVSVRDAILKASQQRFRPIAMTLFSTLFGALPLILSVGAGAEARNAIGWVVFGGLSISVIYTLFLTPVIYLLLARFAKPRSNETARLEAELKHADRVL